MTGAAPRPLAGPRARLVTQPEQDRDRPHDRREHSPRPSPPPPAAPPRNAPNPSASGACARLAPSLRPTRRCSPPPWVALILTAIVSLTLPLAVRRVVDGFESSSVELLDQYFLALLGVAIIFAGGAALRFYLVTRLGERVVADIRKTVFRPQ